MRILPVCAVIGEVLLYFALAFVPPLILALVDQHWMTALSFAGAAALCVAIGAVAHRAFSRADSFVFHRTEALAIVAFTWLTLGVVGGVPYIAAGLSFWDALFETISGLTTTGATVLTDFGAFDRSLFLWRAMTQWFGGLGIIALFIAVLPRLGIAGRQLFFAEASGAPGEALMPQVRHTASRLWILYSGLTLLLFLLLMLAGMSAYDAICHAFTTLSAGGFSPNGSSIAGYHSAAIEWILVPFMIISGTSFTLLYLAMTRGPDALLRDGEFTTYFASAVALSLAVTLVLSGGRIDEESLRLAFFQVTSLMSSTGFASTDYNQWDDSARVILVLAMLIGGCAGSAAGGAKVVRHLIMFKHVRREITRTLHPQAIIPLRYKDRAVDNSVVRAVFNLVVLFVVGYFFVGTYLVVRGADMVTGFSAAIACLGNVGPGFGPTGPMGNFAHFEAIDKVVLTLAMWIGRLEIVTVLALFHTHVWRSIRLR